MPFIKEKFPTYNAFALASLSDVYGSALEKAEKFEANTLGTGIFWNEGTGSDGQPVFKYQPLDRIAQVAPAFGTVAADVDGDGLTDLLLAQNFHSPQIETGHYDGGLGQLLLNRGKRHFEPVPAGLSGIVMPRDSKAATVSDLDGDGVGDLVVTTNNGPCAALLNRDADPSRFVRVVLPLQKAAGARVTLAMDGGQSQVQEYHAGAGYMSQSPAVLTFGTGSARGPGRLKIQWPDGSVEDRPITASDRVIALAR